MMHRARRGGGNNPAIGIVQINPVATLNIAGNCNVTRHLQRCLVAPTFGEVLTAVQNHSGFCHSYVLAVRVLKLLCLFQGLKTWEPYAVGLQECGGTGVTAESGPATGTDEWHVILQAAAKPSSTC